MHAGLAALPLVLVLCMFLIACVSALFVLHKNRRAGMGVGIILVLVGGASNIIDRIRHGYVIDWIPVGGVFVTNIADGIIIIGILTCLYYFYDSTRTIDRARGTRKRIGRG